MVCDILPVIHYADANQATRNAECAIEAGCAGVMLIDMSMRDATGAMFAAAAIKRRFPAAHVGINQLGADIEVAVHDSLAAGVDSIWTDYQLTHTSGSGEADARRLRAIMGVARPISVFCAVAFKYQAHEPDPANAAARAIALGFIPTTSGPSTGVAAHPARIERMRELIGPKAPLAIASGITPENAPLFAPLVSHILVSTGVSSSFYEFDQVRLNALVEATRFADPSKDTPNAE